MKPKPRLVKDTGVKEAGVLILEGSQGESEILAGVRHIAVNILSNLSVILNLTSNESEIFYKNNAISFTDFLGGICLLKCAR